MVIAPAMTSFVRPMAVNTPAALTAATSTPNKAAVNNGAAQAAKAITAIEAMMASGFLPPPPPPPMAFTRTNRRALGLGRILVHQWRGTSSSSTKTWI